MKKIFFLFLNLLVICVALFFSCKKERSCEGCKDHNKPPIAIAGPDQFITLPTDSVLLDGRASSDPDGKISEWRWRRISGPASVNIPNPTAAKTSAKNLLAGVYHFELTVKDDGGLQATDTMQVTVNSETNHAPVANAGQDQTITLPNNTVLLDGSGSTDPDNDITTYLWRKISGPSSFTISNTNAVQTPVAALVEGAYQFELKVTDAVGLFSRDTVNVTINTSTVTTNCNVGTRPQVTAQLVPLHTLSVARHDVAIASASNKILFAGGWFDGGGYSSRVDIYDIVNNSWSIAELSRPRKKMATTVQGNKIFFAGGKNTGDNLFGNVDIYDVSTNTWAVSYLSREADGLAAATAGNKVFFAGGNSGIYAVSTVDIYDLATNTWSTASLSTPRNFVTAVSTNNKVYFTGGDPSTGQTSNVIDIYDNATGSWSTSTLQVRRVYQAAVAVNDILYFAGGTSNNSQTICSVETLNTNTGARTLMNLFGPASWSIDDGENAVVKDDEIIFLRHDGGADANKFDIYNVQTNAWSIGVLPQPIPRGASVISVNNTIYVAGGFVNGTLSNQVWKLEF